MNPDERTVGLRSQDSTFPLDRTRIGVGEPEKRRTASEDAFAAAGRRGGETVKERYGTPFFQTIGRLGAERGAEKGGIARKKELGSEGYAKLGRMGGKAVVQKYGSEHMREIGRKGGKARVAQSRAIAEEAADAAPGPGAKP